MSAFNSSTCWSISGSDESVPFASLCDNFLFLFCFGSGGGDAGGAIPFAWSIPNNEIQATRNVSCAITHLVDDT